MWFQIELRVETGKPCLRHCLCRLCHPCLASSICIGSGQIKKKSAAVGGGSIDFTVGIPWLRAWLCDLRNTILSLSSCDPL